MLPMLLRPPEEPSTHLISVSRTGRGVSIVVPNFAWCWTVKAARVRGFSVVEVGACSA